MSFLNIFESKNPIPSVGDTFECLSDSMMEGAPCTGKITRVIDNEITLVRNDQEETKTINLDDCSFAQTDSGVWLIDAPSMNEGYLSERIKGKLKIVSHASLDKLAKKTNHKALSKRPKESDDVTKRELDQLERYLDSVWEELDIDVEFTRHFLDRINDSRNGRQITIEEIEKLFIDSFKKHGKAINSSGNRHKNIGGVLSDKMSNVNAPFFLKWDNSKKEFELVVSTVMRKRNFKPNNSSERKYVVEKNLTLR